MRKFLSGVRIYVGSSTILQLSLSLSVNMGNRNPFFFYVKFKALYVIVSNMEMVQKNSNDSKRTNLKLKIGG